MKGHAGCEQGHRMGRIRLVFEYWRRLRTSEMGQKLSSTVPGWEAKEASVPDTNTSHQPLAQLRNG